MGHSPVIGALRTNMKGACLDAFRVTIGGTGAPTLVDNGKSGLLSVVRTSAGLYTFTIVAPVPPKLIAVMATLSCISGTGALNTVRYVEGSYNASAGTFQLVVTDDEATPAAVDPTNGVAIDVLLLTQLSNF